MSTRSSLVLAALISLGAACAPPPNQPAPAPAPNPAYTYDVDLAPTIPDHCGCTNYVLIIKTHAVNWGYPAGTVMRIDKQQADFVANHGGYTLIIELP